MVQPMTDYPLGTVLGAYENEELTEKKHLVLMHFIFNFVKRKMTK